MAVEKEAKEIIQNINRLRGELNKFNDDFTKVGKHLGNSRSSYDDALKHLEKFSDKLEKLERPVAKESLPL